MPLLLLATVPPAVPGDDAVSWLLSSLKWAVERFQAHDYVPAIGMLVMVLVYLFNRFAKDRIASKHLPLVSASIGVLTAIATNLLALAVGSTPLDWVQAVLAGLTAGAAASGFWSLVGKHLAERLGLKPTGSP